MLDRNEREQLAKTLYNYVEETYAKHDRSYREFLDHLIEQYRREGLSGFSPLDRGAFLELVAEVL